MWNPHLISYHICYELTFGGVFLLSQKLVLQTPERHLPMPKSKIISPHREYAETRRFGLGFECRTGIFTINSDNLSIAI